MCGRYSLAKNEEYLKRRFDIKTSQNIKPRYNVAPSQIMPVITNKNLGEFSFFQWGLIPNWSLDASTANNFINARAETILTKSPFRQYVKDQRCLIPADGFFEWKKIGKERVPHRITLADDDAFAFAGLWDSWEDREGNIVNTYTIITTSSNEIMKELHERMPVILMKDKEQEWLSEKISDSEIINLLKPYDSNKMSYYKAHRTVNSSMYDLPECIQVAPKIYPGETLSLFD